MLFATAGKNGRKNSVDKTLFMVGNAHIDPVWLWRWQDGYSEIRASFRSALDRMKEYPEFVFTSASASCYEWIERNDPAMFEEIRERVAEGRWCLAGGMWVQPDCNHPSGESFARHVLYSQRYFLEKFGRIATTGYNVDSFGHTGSLPKILRMAGMDSYVFLRPGSHEKNYPAWVFRWEGPEGQSVKAARIPFEYCTWGKELSAHVKRCAGEVRDSQGLMCFYGVGNHGGGPTKENLDSIRELDGKDGVKLLMSSPDDYFAQVSTEGLPTVNGDLLHHASGCYSAHSGIKQWNRQAENRLTTAEKWSLFAAWLQNKDYPQKDYERAWKKVLFNQFHDILAGTSIIEACEDAREDYGFALSLSAEHLNDALQAIMRDIDIPFVEGALPFVVFNTQGFDTRYPVSLEIAALKGPMKLVDSQGQEVVYQLSAASAAARGRAKLNFIADLPAMGWQVYTLIPAAEQAEEKQDVQDESLILENNLLKAAFDPVSGHLSTLLHKESDVQMLRSQAFLSVREDTSDTWSHMVFSYPHEVGRMLLEDIRVSASGPLFKTISAKYIYNKSSLIIDYTLYQGIGQVFTRWRLNWQETQKVLKYCLPLAHHHCHTSAQAPYGSADRHLNGEEYPMQQWLDISGITPGPEQVITGLSVLNDAKTSYSAVSRSMEITLARSAYYANHDPFVVEEGMDYPLVDQGLQTFHLSLLPHAGRPENSQTDRQAMLLNAPPVILPESFHPGKLPQKKGLLRLEAEHTVIDGIKLSETSQDHLVIHLHEYARRQEEAILHLDLLNQSIKITMKPGEIKALRINMKDGSYEYVNLIEEAL